MKLSIVVPAHNEEKRIGTMLRTYHKFFKEVRAQNDLDFEFVVVLNGCKDRTIDVVEDVKRTCGGIVIVDLPQSGKGLAIKAGFADALARPNDLIGFVDADMATEPQYFYDLVIHLLDFNTPFDGVIASRYMFGALVQPARPKYKRWGSKLIYETWVRLLFGLKYHDYQCGAKLFTREVIAKVTPELTVQQWAFDVELLYLCKKYGFKIKEIPTVWRDQHGSTLSPIRAGLRMLASIFRLRIRHSSFGSHS